MGSHVVPMAVRGLPFLIGIEIEGNSRVSGFKLHIELDNELDALVTSHVIRHTSFTPPPGLSYAYAPNKFVA